MNIVLPLVAIGGMSLVFGLLLGILSKVFEVKDNKMAEQIRNVLPGANCGACGFAGCDEYAKSVAEGKCACNKCTVGGTEVADKISQIAEIPLNKTDKYVACVMCAGSVSVARTKYIYKGKGDCYSAQILGGGDKLCEYACIGLGSCVSKCKFDAIHIKNGVAVVERTKCTACGKCVIECPKNIIRLIPFESKYMIMCSSSDKGKTVKNNCDVGCISCGVCVKICPENAIEIKNNLPEIDFDKCINCGKCFEKCPRNIIEMI